VPLRGDSGLFGSTASKSRGQPVQSQRVTSSAWDEQTDRRYAFRQRGVVVVDDGKQRRHRSQVVVRRLALQQLDDGRTDTPYIGRGARTRQLDDFRGHPVRRADDLGLSVFAPTACESAGRDPEISELDDTVLGRQNIGPLYVSVNDTLVVQILQALENLGHVQTDEVLWELAKLFAN